MVERLVHDVRYAARFLRRTPGFALTAIAVLALGIGANTAVFSVARDVLLRPLPYPEPERLVQYVSRTRAGHAAGPLASVPKFNAWREGIRSHESIAAFHGSGPGVTLIAGDRREQVPAMFVSAGYFHVFRAPVAFGRTFTNREDYPQGPRLAVISHDFWLRHFGRTQNPVGLVLTLADGAYEIVGVLGASFRPQPHADIWLPLQAPTVSFNHTNYLTVVARLKPHVTLATADAQARNTTVGFRLTFPLALGPYEEFGAEPLEWMIAGDTRGALQMLTGAVVLVLLIACANAANLFVARATRRKADIATRAALGAARPRLVRQLFAECLMLSLAGGAVGFALGFLGIRALMTAIPDALASGVRVTADSQVLLFTLSTSILTALTFGLLPVLGASRVDLSTVLKDTSDATTISGQHRRQSFLAVAEIALALVLLVGAAALVRTFVGMQRVDRGFRTQGLVTFEMPLGTPALQSTDAVDSLVRDVERRLEHVPGVDGVAAAYALPQDPMVSISFTFYGRALLSAPYHGVGSYAPVSARYFEVFGISLQRGRTFDKHDTRDTQPVVIINQAMARRFWHTTDPVGEKIFIGKRADGEFDERPRLIVGVVADVKEIGAAEYPEPRMYVPTAQTSDRTTARNNRFFPLLWVVRTAADGAGVRAAVEQELRAATGGLAIARVRRIEDILRAATAQLEFTAVLLSVFAAAALALAVVGLYGLMAYSVEQRRREIGIRLALGAGPAALRNMVLSEGGRIAAVGVVIGLAGAFAASRVLNNQIVGVAGWDATLFVGVAALLALVTFVAAYLPAQAATDTNPVEALRS
jgi:putative ABC transport system permease protein